MGSAITGILLAVTFIIFVLYAMKGGNLTVGFFVMAVLWTIIGMVPFFFEQKTAYEILRSDWSSDVCSSDLEFSPTAAKTPPGDDSHESPA